MVRLQANIKRSYQLGQIPTAALNHHQELE